MSTPGPVSTLTEFADALQVIAENAAARAATENVAGATDLRVYYARPRGAIELPAIYSVLLPSEMEPVDYVTDRDSLVVGLRVAIAYTDAEPESRKLFALTDLVCRVLDQALKDDDGPMRGADVRRIGLHVVSDEFNNVPVLAIELPIRARLEHHNPPSFTP